MCDCVLRTYIFVSDVRRVHVLPHILQKNNYEKKTIGIYQAQRFIKKGLTVDKMPAGIPPLKSRVLTGKCHEK